MDSQDDHSENDLEEQSKSEEDGTYGISDNNLPESKSSAPTKPIRIACDCGASLSVPADRIGKKARCPHCRSILTVRRSNPTMPRSVSRKKKSKKKTLVNSKPQKRISKNWLIISGLVVVGGALVLPFAFQGSSILPWGDGPESKLIGHWKIEVENRDDIRIFEFRPNGAFVYKVVDAEDVKKEEYPYAILEGQWHFIEDGESDEGKEILYISMTDLYSNKNNDGFINKDRSKRRRFDFSKAAWIRLGFNSKNEFRSIVTVKSSYRLPHILHRLGSPFRIEGIWTRTDVTIGETHESTSSLTKDRSSPRDPLTQFGLERSYAPPFRTDIDSLIAHLKKGEKVEQEKALDFLANNADAARELAPTLIEMLGIEKEDQHRSNIVNIRNIVNILKKLELDIKNRAILTIIERLENYRSLKPSVSQGRIITNNCFPLVRGLLDLGANSEQKEKPISILLELLKVPAIFQDDPAAKDLLFAMTKINAYKTHSKQIREILEEIVIVKGCYIKFCEILNRLEKDGNLGETSRSLVKKSHEFLDALRSGNTAAARKFLHTDAPKLRDLASDEKLRKFYSGLPGAAPTVFIVTPFSGMRDIGFRYGSGSSIFIMHFVFVYENSTWRIKGYPKPR